MAFTATARIPCRPLSVDHKDLAEPKELLIDYNTGIVTVCKADGTFVDISDSIKTVIMNHIKSDKDVAKEIQVEIDGKLYTLETAIADQAKSLEDLKKALGFVKDEAGNIKFDIIEYINKIFNINKDSGTVSIDASSITDNDQKVMMTKQERDKLNSLSPGQSLQVTLSTNWTGDEAPYTQVVGLNGVKDTDVPVVDIILNSDFDTAMEELNSYGFLYRVTTGNNQITVYTTEKTTVQLRLQLKFDRTVQGG